MTCSCSSLRSSICIMGIVMGRYIATYGTLWNIVKACRKSSMHKCENLWDHFAAALGDSIDMHVRSNILQDCALETSHDCAIETSQCNRNMAPFSPLLSSLSRHCHILPNSQLAKLSPYKVLQDFRAKQTATQRIAKSKLTQQLGLSQLSTSLYEWTQHIYS